MKFPHSTFNPSRSHKGTVFVEALVVYAFHGTKHERAAGQSFILDLLIELDLSAAQASDHLKDTVDYGAVVNAATRLFCTHHARLIEKAAEVTALGLLNSFPSIDVVEICVRKPHAAMSASFKEVGVVIRRQSKRVLV
jgi:7,8-dihydroneopterin aldolase/epimerase/oxygenase